MQWARRYLRRFDVGSYVLKAVGIIQGVLTVTIDSEVFGLAQQILN